MKVCSIESTLEQCYTLNVWFREKQLVLFPESPDVVKGNIRTRGKTKLTSFPRDHTLSVLLYI